MWSYLSSIFSRQEPPIPPEELPPAKVAIIGAGMGGCFTAKFLRENGGEKLDIHVWMKKGCRVGGRTATCEIAGHTYECGASIMHSKNKYLSDAVKEFGLEKKGESDPSVPVGIYNGTSFLVKISAFKVYSYFQLLWRYGFDLFKMSRSVSAMMKNFKTIYSIQANGKAFSTAEDMLTAMGGVEMYEKTQVLTSDHFLNALHLNQTLVEEIFKCATRANYGQDLTVNAFTAYVSLAGMEDGSLWSVVGGNWKIAEKVLEASGATVVEDDIISVKKTLDENGKTKFTITTEDGTVTSGYDVVVVANPLNLSSIKYENFPYDFYTAAATTPYQRIVTTLIHGTVNQKFFGIKSDEHKFPQIILTTSSDGSPFQFNCVTVEVPSDVSQEGVREYCKPIGDDPKRVWKVFSPQLLTEEQLQLMFTDIESTQVHDWQAYPHYSPPEQIPPFVLDDGVYYINAIEKAASAMEMSAIGAKNAALLTKDYILEQNE